MLETVTQLTAILPNRPGALADLLKVLEESKVNVLALCVVDTAEHGLVRFVVDDPARAQSSLEQCGMPFGVNAALSLLVPNLPGALAQAARKLGAAKVNIDYAYCSAGGPGEARVILGASNPKKAQTLLGKD
ncbi:MAG TPA: hypothetical protein P5137_16845 [Candidatus Brocadiia bacterium]|nr:hypothetical protein [Candidatus Brocadiia bacterium]